MAHIASGSTRGNDTNAGSAANAFEQRVATHPQAPRDATAGTNTSSPAYTFELRVTPNN